jgi:signal transduction protein with GAF and PtsI domain
MAFALLGLGVRQLSVAPRSVARVKRIVRGVSVTIAKRAAEAALQAPTARRSEEILRGELFSAFGDAPFRSDGLPENVAGNIFEGYGGQ